jgi:hypothetical protein
MSGDCPKGYIRRKGYTRRYRNNIKRQGYTVRKRGKVFRVFPHSNQTMVNSTCIKNRGLPGKGPIGPNSIGTLRKGELIKYGYSYRLSDSMRRAALKKAIEHYSALSVYHKLDAVAKYTVRTAPDASKIFNMDKKWVAAHYELKKETI